MAPTPCLPAQAREETPAAWLVRNVTWEEEEHSYAAQCIRLTPNNYLIWIGDTTHPTDPLTLDSLTLALPVHNKVSRIPYRGTHPR